MWGLKIFVLNGPSLNLLGVREPEIYGHTTLAEINAGLVADGRARGFEVDCRQSNHEGQLIDWVQEARTTAHGLIVNAGAYSHSSIGLADAISAVKLPMVEVHLSNIFAREPFRHHSYLSAVAIGVICGLGPVGYRLALSALIDRLNGAGKAV
jgi:3-dehydroquinate dehydratase-2